MATVQRKSSMKSTSSPPDAESLPIEKLSVNDDVQANEVVEETEEPVEKGTTLYPKILKLRDCLHEVRRLGLPVDSIHLTGTVKLHGTHADIVFSDASDEVRLQSRNQLMLTPKDDNAGFAAFMTAIDKTILLNLRDRITARFHELNPNSKATGDIVVAGEWCGTGVQKKVALDKIPKFFAIVSININGTWVPDWNYRDIHNESARIYHIGKAGFYTHEVKLDDVPDSERIIKDLTDAIDAECPFAKLFGVSGRGEGIVWKVTNRCGRSNFWFKSKGDLLAVSHSDKLPKSAVDPQNKERVDNFARAIVTENRLLQGWQSLNKKDISRTGDFLMWVTNDCLTEEKREMKELNIDEKQLRKAIALIAKQWFRKEVKGI